MVATVAVVATAITVTMTYGMTSKGMGKHSFTIIMIIQATHLRSDAHVCACACVCVCVCVYVCVWVCVRV